MAGDEWPSSVFRRGPFDRDAEGWQKVMVARGMPRRPFLVVNVFEIRLSFQVVTQMVNDRLRSKKSQRNACTSLYRSSSFSTEMRASSRSRGTQWPLSDVAPSI